MSDKDQAKSYAYASKYKYMTKSGSASSGVYCLGVLGAAVFYIQHAPTFWIGALGVLKAFFWPAFLVYKLLEVFKF